MNQDLLYCWELVKILVGEKDVKDGVFQSEGIKPNKYHKDYVSNDPHLFKRLIDASRKFLQQQYPFFFFFDIHYDFFFL